MKENQIEFQGCLITIDGHPMNVETVLNTIKELNKINAMNSSYIDEFRNVKQSKVELKSELEAIRNGEKRKIIQDILKQEIENPTGKDEPDMDETIKKYKSEGIDSIEDLFN